MMARWGIRARVMFVAVVPMLALAALMTAGYTGQRLSDLDAALGARGRAYARQLAAASEYPVFSGNGDALRQLARALLGEDDVIGVEIFGSDGRVLARAERRDGRPRAASGTLRIIESIPGSHLEIDDGFSFAPPGGPPRPAGARGSVLVELSLARLQRRRSELLWTGVGSMLVVLAGSLLLAHRMSRGVSGPIRSVASTVLRIGHGQLHERVTLSGGGSLRRLAEGVNEMATRLSEAHADMERRIDEATAELRARKDEAERANLAKSRFLAAASHDLRQPMHALGLFISELAQHELPPRSGRLVERIAVSAGAMENLLDSLLDISRLDAGVLQPAMRTVALQPLLERIAAEHEAAAQARGLRLRVRALPCRARTDPVLLERILSNLVSNAIRYTARGGVLLACRRRAQRLCIEVRDSGVGIAAEFHEIVFQEFVQLDNAERARDKGLGLGLAIVRRLADLLGHGLALRSAPGRGSVFAVELPAATQEALADHRDDTRALGGLDGLRVALVDDDPLAREGMASLLSSWGCQVSAAETAQELLARLAAAGPHPELLITDFRLRGPLNGIELIERVRAHPPTQALPTILISGDTAPEMLGLAKAAQQPLLHKPVRPARLRALIHRLLGAQ